MRRKLRKFLRSLIATRAPSHPVISSPFLDRLKARQIPIETIIDVGASNGSWSKDMMTVYPQARYLCIEAAAEHEPALKQFVAQHSDAAYVIAAAGDSFGETNFYCNPEDLFGGAAAKTTFRKHNRVVPMVTIDGLCEKRQLNPPYLLKLDTHGFELPILAGATGVLSQSNLLFIEAYNFHFRPGMLLFHQLVAHLEREGFRCLDMENPIWRKKDNAFWQVDILFGKNSLPEFQSNTYR